MRRAPQSGMQPLTPIEFHILLSLADGERHGYAILQDVSDRTGEKLRTGTLYTVIKRLLDSAWIEDGDAPGEDDDERRRYYRLTDGGREALKNEARRLQDLVALAQEKRVLTRPRKLAPERGR
jgi:DNA-binding PadR family transcriptional regulator